jgi:hypothetical protein
MNPLIQFVQQYAPLFVVLGAAATVLGLAFTTYKASHDRQVKGLREENRQLQSRLHRYEKVTTARAWRN